MKKGFTLVEILIYASVVSLIVGVMGTMLLWAIRSQAKSKAINETAFGAQRAMEIMSREIRSAQGIYTPSCVFGSHPGQLSIQTRSYVPQGEELGYIDFFICGTQLCLKKEAQNPIAITSENTRVTNLVFSKIGSSDANITSVRINMALDYESSFAKPEYQSSITVTSSAAIRSSEGAGN